MSRFRATIIVNLPQRQAHAVCLAAFSDLGWTISGVAQTRIAGQERVLPAPPALCPVRVAIILSEPAHDATELTLHGVSFDCEPLQEARVRDCVAEFIRAIEQRANPVPPLSPALTVPGFRGYGQPADGWPPLGSPALPIRPSPREGALPFASDLSTHQVP